MRLSEQVKPISYLKDNTARVNNEITQSREPMIITQNGEVTFVVQDIKSWEQTQQTMALLKILALVGNRLNAATSVQRRTLLRYSTSIPASRRVARNDVPSVFLRRTRRKRFRN